MKSYLALTWKELKTQKITATLILIAVIMSTIITTVVGQSIGILQSMRIEQAASLNGNRYVTFHQLSREQAQKLHEDDRVYDVGDMCSMFRMAVCILLRQVSRSISQNARTEQNQLREAQLTVNLEAEDREPVRILDGIREV